MTEVRDEWTYREAVEALGQAQKSPRGISWYSLLINRPAGRRLAAAAAVSHLTPNLVTILSALLSVAAPALLVLVHPSAWVGVAAAASLVLAFALDSADGQLARLQGSGSPRGEWLDHMVDCAVKILLHSGVLIAWWRFTDREGALLLPLAMLLVSGLLFFGIILVPKLLPPRDAATSQRSAKVSRVLLLPVDSGVIGLMFVLWGWQDGFVVVYALALAAQAAVLGAFCRLWWRDLA